MKLSFLLLPALLALSSASLLDIVKQSSQHRNVSLLKPDLQDRVPETAANMSVPTRQSPPSPAKLRQKRQTWFQGYGKLKWKTWTGSLPNGAVSIDNEYVGRTDYVCKNGCESGFYNHNMGSYCHNPFKGKEYRNSQFEILVNEDNFEKLEWIKGSRGSVPSNSIRTCSSDELYVGKHWYGLGKVHPAHNCFYLPWKGYEYRYSDYEVLKIRKDFRNQYISFTRYNLKGAETIWDPPVTMQVSEITNNACNTVSKRIALSKTSKLERRWDYDTSFLFDVTTKINEGFPIFESGKLKIGPRKILPLSRGQTLSEEISHAVSVELSVPPNKKCRVLMVGQKYTTNIPFTARFIRDYRGGVSDIPITGMYYIVGIGRIKSVIEQCEPVTNSWLFYCPD